MKFILGRPQGQLESLVVEGLGSSKRVTGIKTCDGLTHYADLVVVACEYIDFHEDSDHGLIPFSRWPLVFNCHSRSASFSRGHNGNSHVR